MDRLEGRGEFIALQYDAYIQQAEDRIAQACERAGRKRSDIQVIAVTKYIDSAGAGSLLEKGLTHLGENRWQAAKEKWGAIGEQAVWHFIGHLQTNKVKDVIGRFDYLHALDRSSLLQAVQKQASRLDIVVPAFIQLNVSGEDTKYGLAPEDLFTFAEEAAGCPNIRIIGLMTMAPHEADPEQTRPVFRRLRELRDELNERRILPEPAPHLSMGMSNDFEVAIEEGATWLRLGSILLGR